MLLLLLPLLMLNPTCMYFTYIRIDPASSFFRSFFFLLPTSLCWSMPGNVSLSSLQIGAFFDAFSVYLSV
jgi:hypothetical protein